LQPITLGLKIPNVWTIRLSGVATVLRAPVQRHVTGRLSPPSNKAVKQFCFLQPYM